MAQIQVFDLLAPVAQVCRGCNVTTLTEAYVHAVRELCRTSKVYTTTLLGETVADQAIYNLGSDAYSEIVGVPAVSITAATDDIRALDSLASGRWDADDETDVPEFFDYVPEAQLALHPTPDAIYPVSIALALQPKRGSNSIDDALVVQWDEAFRCGALAYLLRLPGMPWTDKQEANRRDADFRAWVNRATSAAQRRYAAPVRPVW